MSAAALISWVLPCLFIPWIAVTAWRAHRRWRGLH